MDYSQFLVMHQEIGLLVLILLVFLYDTFSNTTACGVSYLTVCGFAVITLLGFVQPWLGTTTSAFGGMYATSPVMGSIKNILNIGVLIVLIQSMQWADSEYMRIRRGEFYELLLMTLLGMYFMISLPSLFAVYHWARNCVVAACRSCGI